MIELEFHPKDTELLKEGLVNTKAYMVIKGEIELKSKNNLYTLALHARKNQDYRVMCNLYRNKASGFGNASSTVMYQHLGIVQKGFWIGEEYKLQKNQYVNEFEGEVETGYFSQMMGILDLYFKSQMRLQAEKNAKGKPPIP